MGQSPSIPVEHARLIFSNSSLRNSVLQCDALGLHYQLSTPMEGMKNQRLTTITRWDPRSDSDVVLAEWSAKRTGGDTIRLSCADRPLIVDASDSEGDGFIPMKAFFPRTGGFAYHVHFKRTFTANNGKRYTWESNEVYLRLYEEGSEIPIAEYGEAYFLVAKRNAHIRIAPGCEDIIDLLVLTCIIAERQRREARGEPI